ncbi:hypothetical protein [Helicobacter trogontum]|uniref:Lipoprotein n=1 Tax=Helicobacter trogontum TaxID=50960 RepID=A0A4U8T3M5_9HELI|nr:hypothetical protein [Helicobacter trogontum]MCI5786149.1 hypothetical protein [Helicobacter trogontum]MDY5186055.1 hypothetical protein [Helicobacter trogontum]TLD94061.1 hypothetical protein LS80_010435 [Helicobacter trogontum]
MYMRFVFLCCMNLYFVACSSLTIKPDNIVSYNNGIAIMQDTKEKSKVQVEIAQEEIGGFDRIPLVFYITIENLSDDILQFSTENISIVLDGTTIKPYSFQALSRSSFSLSQALYDYGIEITPPNFKVNDPFFSMNAYHVYPMPFVFNDGFFMTYRFYDYSFSRANFYNMQLESFNARKFLISHYLRRNTLRKNDVKGGFVLIPYKNLRAGDMHIQVNVGSEAYDFLVKLSKMK